MTPLSERPAQSDAMPWVWVVVAILIGTICVSALAAIGNPPELSGDQVRIHKVLLEAETDFELTLDEPKPEEIERVAKSLEELEIMDPAAQGTRDRALLILRRAADPEAKPAVGKLAVDFNEDIGDALTPDAESADDIAKVNEALRKTYSSEELTETEASEIAQTFAEYGGRWPMQFAVEHARTLTGKEMPTGDKTTAGLVIMTLLVMGIGAMIWLFTGRGQGKIPASGTAADGDNLGARFLMFGVVFAIVGATVAASFDNKAYGLAAAEVAVILVMFAVITLPLKRRTFTLKDIGIRFDQLGSDLLHGIAGYLANFPAAFILILLGSALLSWIPSGGHPIESDLLAGNNIAIILLSAGPLTAILEELAFRGLLFQGLALRFRVWPAIFISAMGFAMIHPQGGMLWPSLAWVGGMAAYLTYRQSSLIPAIVMHALHNTTLILLSRLYTGN